MELVEGDDLSQRIARGPIPLDEALPIARQIAEALEAAHEQGIIHRDLKPANIKIRPDGAVKVLDFGLAKALSAEMASASVDNSPTLTAHATMMGMILGTPAYMAPEQARGKPVDKRADIWAFGVVFYEMLTGRRAFDGEDVSSILAAVLQSEPRWDGVPPNLRRVLESCLEKDPRNRLRDIGDVWRLVDDVPTPAASSLRPTRMGWMAAAALAGVAAIALWAPWRKAPTDVAPLPVKLDVDLGSDVSLEPLVGPTFSTLVISPDGTRLVFVGSVSRAPSRLFVRRLDDWTMRELAGTQGATNPFISPDGQWVAFWKDGKIAKVPLEGGAVVPLADLGEMGGGSWADNGDLVVGTGSPSTAGLVRIASGGGSPTPIVNLASGELFYTFPHVVAGRKAVLFAAVGSPPSIETTNIDIVSLENGRRKTLVRGGASPRYLSSGHLVYASRAGMFAVPFDIDSWETRGPAVRDLRGCDLRPDDRRRTVRCVAGHDGISKESRWFRIHADARAVARRHGQAGAAARQAGRVCRAAACIARRARCARNKGWRQPGHVGVRPAARYDDSLDFWGWDVSQSRVEPGRTLRRLRVDGRRYPLGTCRRRRATAVPFLEQQPLPFELLSVADIRDVGRHTSVVRASRREGAANLVRRIVGGRARAEGRHANAVPQDCVSGRRRRLFTRRPMDRVSLEQIGQVRGLRTAVLDITRERKRGADFQRRWRTAGMVAEGSRAVLSGRGTDHGRSLYDARRVVSRGQATSVGRERDRRHRLRRRPGRQATRSHPADGHA